MDELEKIIEGMLAENQALMDNNQEPKYSDGDFKAVRDEYSESQQTNIETTEAVEQSAQVETIEASEEVETKVIKEEKVDDDTVKLTKKGRIDGRSRAYKETVSRLRAKRKAKKQEEGE